MMNDLFGGIYHFEKPRETTDSPLRERHNSKHKWMLDKEHLFSINFLSVKKITLLSCLISKSDLSNLYPKVLGGELGLFHVFQSASYCSLVYGLQ